MKAFNLLIILILVFAMSSCTFSFDIPRVRKGETQIFEINEEPFSDAEVASINIEMGAGSLDISGGSEKLMEGTITYNIVTWEPQLIRKDDSITIKQNRDAAAVDEYRHEWDLKLGATPIELDLGAGAYEGNLDLGGLAITRLSIADGASKSKVSFSEPNAVEMDKFTYQTGASTVELNGLGNARADRLEFNCGAGSYKFDFTGVNTNDITVDIEGGISDVTIIIPENARVQISVDSELSNTDLTGTWTVENNIYQAGTTGSLISIRVNLALGNLKLVHE